MPPKTGAPELDVDVPLDDLDVAALLDDFDIATLLDDFDVAALLDDFAEEFEALTYCNCQCWL